MISVNQILADDAIGHAVDLQQYSNNVVRRMMAILFRADGRLYSELARALESIDPSSFNVERLESLLYSVRSINRAAHESVGKELTEELRNFVAYEASYQQQVLVSVLPAQISVAAVAPEVIYAAALARPFQGVILNSALSDVEAVKAKRIRQLIAQGFTEGKTTAQIVKELRGTRAKGYSDSLLAKSRKDIETITRTALGHMAGFTQDRFIEANQDLVKATVWHSKLDLRTSDICAPRDLKQYTPVTHKPIGHSLPWLGGPSRAHWNCRSFQTTILKSFKELGIDVPEIVLKDGTRASMDGQAPASTSYIEWIGKQSQARIIERFGATRAAMLKSGKLSASDLYDSKGLYLTLEQLAAKL